MEHFVIIIIIEIIEKADIVVVLRTSRWGFTLDMVC